MSHRRAALAGLGLAMLCGCTSLLIPPDGSAPQRWEYVKQGDAALLRKDFDGAIAAYGSALDLVERYQRASEASGYHPSRAAEALILAKLANAYSGRGAYAEAASYRQRALEIRERENGPTSLYVADLLNDLGYEYRRQGRYAEARSCLERAAGIFEGEGQKPRQAMAVNNIGHVDDAQGRLAEAESAFQRALALTEEAIGQNPQPGHAGFRQNMLHLRDYAAAVRKSGKLDAADRLDTRLAAMKRRVDEYIASLRTRGLEEQAMRAEAWYRRTGEGE
jgi:tetratricopeptide (TPR) repeat protein